MDEEEEEKEKWKYLNENKERFVQGRKNKLIKKNK